jgi:hypothetical protein
MEELPMKILLATAALATLVSSSADAQYGNWRGDYRAYAQVPPYAAYSAYGVNRAYAQVPPPAAYRSYGFNRAYAQAPLPAAYRSNGSNRAYAQVPPPAAYRSYGQAPTPTTYDLYGYRSPYPYSVYDVRGSYVGSDPDPRVRNQLARDPSQGGE